MALISVVVPCYNEARSFPIFFEEFLKVSSCMKAGCEDLCFELVAVDDGSEDETLSVIKQAAGKHVNESLFQVKYLSFSRNFGKEAAIYAGLRTAKGDFVAIMDADMQDPPSLLPQMYEIIKKGTCDNVATRRTDRAGEPVIRSCFARLFYRVMNKISPVEFVDGVRDFRLMSRKMVDAILSVTEYNRFSKGIFSWVGFTTEWISYENIDRVAGNSKWNFFSLFQYSLDGIIAFSTKPLVIASASGLILFFVAIISLVVIVVRTLVFGDPVSGWPSLASIVLLASGLQLFCLGIVGQYLSKTYLETKKRPLYIIRESNVE